MDPERKDLVQENRLTQEKLENAVNNLKSAYRPVCIAADGLNVMDDAGGLYGYTCFLRSIHPEEEAEYKRKNNIEQDEEGADIAPYTDKEIPYPGPEIISDGKTKCQIPKEFFKDFHTSR